MGCDRDRTHSVIQRQNFTLWSDRPAGKFSTSGFPPTISKLNTSTQRLRLPARGARSPFDGAQEPRSGALPFDYAQEPRSGALPFDGAQEPRSGAHSPFDYAQEPLRSVTESPQSQTALG